MVYCLAPVWCAWLGLYYSWFRRLIVVDPHDDCTQNEGVIKEKVIFCRLLTGINWLLPTRQATYELTAQRPVVVHFPLSNLMLISCMNRQKNANVDKGGTFNTLIIRNIPTYLEVSRWWSHLDYSNIKGFYVLFEMFIAR